MVGGFTSSQKVVVLKMVEKPWGLPRGVLEGKGLLENFFFFFFFLYLISWEMETQRDVFCSVKFWHLDSSCCQLQSFICYFLFFEAWIFTIVHSYPNRLVLDADNIPMVLPFVHTGMQEIMPIGASVPRIRKTVSRLTGNVLLVEDSKQQARQLLLIHSSFRPLLPSLNLDFTISPIF